MWVWWVWYGWCVGGVGGVPRSESGDDVKEVKARLPT